ncbi:MAG: sulfite exporter TauE/SafE family protein [Dehalococcoidales bacterium]|nr:sulfite exporter TauE/SafE family protein [Dehalococcoidales bacterium]
MTSLWEILALGLLLGVRHAFDADHLVAVSTIVSEYRNPLRAIWIGVSWGLGHTTTLLLCGAALLFLNLRLPESVSTLMEYLVGGMLILLGVQTLLAFRRRKVHFHSHHHQDDNLETHRHFHSHEKTSEHVHHNPSRWESLSRLLIAGVTPGEHQANGIMKPFFRLKSYLVGTVHGLAGSAALMLLVLAGMRSTWSGVVYILVFGLGTALSMAVISIFISLPFSASGRLPQLNRVIGLTAGIVSIIFGLVLIGTI